MTKLGAFIQIDTVGAHETIFHFYSNKKSSASILYAYDLQNMLGDSVGSISAAFNNTTIKTVFIRSDWMKGVEPIVINVAASAKDNGICNVMIKRRIREKKRKI